MPSIQPRCLNDILPERTKILTEIKLNELIFQGICNCYVDKDIFEVVRKCIAKSTRLKVVSVYKQKPQSHQKHE